MNLALLKHYLATVKHKWHVHRFVWKTCWALLKRSIVHDLSKFSREEADLFADVNSKLKGSTYGSDEYYAQLKRLQPALKHHYAHNSHHPEHYDGGIAEMDLLDVIEMLCDWSSAVLRHENGSLEKSLNHNADRFGFDDQTKEKMERFLREIGAMEPEPKNNA